MNCIKKTVIAAFVLLLFAAQGLLGQATSGSWEYIHYNPQFPVGAAARTHILPNGNYLSIGIAQATDLTPGFCQLLELEPNGRLLQARTLTDTSNTILAPVFEVLDNGDVIMLHSIFTAAVISCYDSSFNRKWQWRDTVPGLRRTRLAPTQDGGVMVTGRFNVPPATNQYRGRLTKLDSTGVAVFDSIYMNDTISLYYGDIHTLPGNNTGFIVADFQRTLVLQADSHSIYRFSPTGEMLWRRRIPSQWNSANPGLPKLRIEMLENGDILATTSIPPTGYGVSLTKLDSSGNLLRTDTFHYPPASPAFAMIDMAVFSDGSGAIMSAGIPLNTNKGRFIHRFDAAGDTLWTSYIDRSFFADHLYFMDTTPDMGLILSGQYDGKPWLLKLDSTGQIRQNHVLGNVFLDSNGNCQQDTLEPSLTYWTVRSKPSNKVALTDSSGRYHLELDSGLHFLSIAPLYIPHDVYCSTDDSVQIYLPGIGDTLDSIDIPISLGVLDSCPLMEVELTSNRTRSCAATIYTINYRNQGGKFADSAYVILTLDTAYTFGSSTLPGIPLGPQTYRFDLGTVLPFQSGSFQVTAAMSCSMMLGETVCSEARIYPDTTCLTYNPNWSRASVAVQGECIAGDSVRFTVSNVGAANMLQPTGFIVVEDDILRLADSLQLNIGADTSLTFASQGESWLMSVRQVPFHPFSSIPRAFVEGCGRDSSGNFETGYITTYPQDEMGPFNSIDCQEVRASYDPNDKQGFPKGIGPDHGILASDQMKYLIRFQNTGNDTAFTVQVRDRISEKYDLSSFRMVATSHSPYSVKFYPDRVVEWTFQPIALVDSATNPEASQGFIKFTIDQVAGNAPGTEIENFVDIYFDHNPPVRTNTAHHTIYEKLRDMITVEVDPPLAGLPATLPFRTYPNPFTEQTTLEFPGSMFRELRLELYDQQGRLVRTLAGRSTNKLVLHRQQLPAGMYFFRIANEQQLLRSGKVIVGN